MAQRSPFLLTIAAVAVLVIALVAFDLASATAGLWALGAGLIVIAILAGTPNRPRPDETSIAEAPPPAPDLIGGLIDAIVDPVLVTRDGRVIEANNAARTLLGNAVLGEDIRLAIRHPAAAERLSDPRQPDGSIEFVGLGGEDRRWEMRISAIIRGYRLIQLIDQTARAAAERMRVDFVANASHELKTPLASLLGYIETLRDDETAADAALRARFLTIMAGEASRMQRLIEDLISRSRIEAEKYRLPDTRVDLVALVDEIVAQLREGGDVRSDDLVVDAAANLPPVMGDRPQLSQMLYNLIGNAMKYGRSGTPVAITLAPTASNMVRLVVRDHGDGIAATHLPRLTERFYRVDAGRSRGLGGTGLGLAIVKHIIERHRGRLEIVSAPGEGVRVTVLLPAAQESGDTLSSKGNEIVTRRTATP
ncbi:MAG: sensor histidine kinase [Sphingomonas sp.]